MTPDDLQWVLRALNRRRPFHPFYIELVSGDRFLVSHPESVVRIRDFFVCRLPDGGHRVFGSRAVSQLIDSPTS